MHEPSASGVGDGLSVSVVVPVRNDAPALPAAVESIVSQHGVEISEILLVVGASEDETERVAQALATRHDAVRVVANSHGGIPQGLNAGLAAATGDVLVRVDAHSVLPDRYISQALETMAATGAVNVAAVQVPTGDSPTQRGIAAAMSHRLGSGGAAYREGTERRRVETGFLGVYETAALRAVGGWDNRFARNEDAELNLRVSRELDREIWLDPRLRVAYAPRATLIALARQYWHYGRWRQQTVRRHRGSLALRQLVPAVAVVAIVVGVALGLLASPWFLTVPAIYLTVLVTAAATAPGLALRERPLMFGALATMHLAWGAGFLASWVRPPR